MAMHNISFGTIIAPKADLYALKASCYYYLGENQSTEVEVNKALQIDTTHRTAIALQNLLKGIN